MSWFKAHWKVKYICKWSYKIAGGNQYLCDYAKKFNRNVVLIPTCVDMTNRYNREKDQHNEKVVIGWTGSHSTLVYLEYIAPVLSKIAKDRNVEILIICNKPPSFNFPKMTFLPWEEETEIEDLLKINIGIMPLIEDTWSEGKCGFKIIQYLSLGIPAVASPVGVNKTIIEHNINGFLCSSEDEWSQALSILIEKIQLRVEFGKSGRRKIAQHYSLEKNTNKFISLFS